MARTAVLTGRGAELDRDAERKRRVRLATREVQIPGCEYREPNVRLEANDTQWLRHYFHELFWYPFTTQQLEMILAIRNAILYGGDQAIAASRGAGKTKIFERTLLKYRLAGVIKFSAMFAATDSAAQTRCNRSWARWRPTCDCEGRCADSSDQGVASVGWPIL